MKSLRNTFALTVLIGAQGLLFCASAVAAGKTCKLEITGNDMMQFDKKELSAAADCSEIELTLHHAGKLPAQAMGHNWVLAKTADAAAVANAGLSASIKNNYIPEGDKRVIAHTKLIGGGETTSVKFPTSALKKGEDYTFECTFPGHSALMKGKFTFG